MFLCFLEWNHCDWVTMATAKGWMPWFGPCSVSADLACTTVKHMGGESEGVRGDSDGHLHPILVALLYLKSILFALWICGA